MDMSTQVEQDDAGGEEAAGGRSEDIGPMGQPETVGSIHEVV